MVKIVPTKNRPKTSFKKTQKRIPWSANLYFIMMTTMTNSGQRQPEEEQKKIHVSILYRGVVYLQMFVFDNKMLTSHELGSKK